MERAIPCSWIERLNIFKIPVISNLICRFKDNSKKSISKLLCGCQQIDSEFYMKRQKSQNSQHSGLPQWFSGKESDCNAGAAGEASSIPGLGRSPGGGHAIHSSILARIIPWTEEPPKLQSMGSQKSWTWLKACACTHTHTHTHTHTDSHTPPHRKLRSHMPCGVGKKKDNKGYSKSLWIEQCILGFLTASMKWGQGKLLIWE